MALVIDPEAEEKPPSEKEPKTKPRRRAPARKRKATGRGLVPASEEKPARRRRSSKSSGSLSIPALDEELQARAAGDFNPLRASYRADLVEAYSKAKEQGLDRIDLYDPAWLSLTEGLAAQLKSLSVRELTISTAFTPCYQLVVLQEAGYRIQGVTVLEKPTWYDKGEQPVPLRCTALELVWSPAKA